MLRRSPRRTLEAIVTNARAAIVALAGFDLKRSVTKQAQSKSIELSGSHDIARGGTFRARSCEGEVGHRNERLEFATQSEPRGVVPQVCRMIEVT